MEARRAPERLGGGNVLLEETDPLVQNAPHHGGALRVDEVVVGVGPREGHDQRNLHPAGQREGQRARAVGVERVDQRGAVRLDLGGDRRLLLHREIPNTEGDATLSQPCGDPRDRHGVAADRWVGERCEDSDPGGHRREDNISDGIPRTRWTVYI